MGRLDAVNAFEPSVSLISAIGVDHRAWLGTIASRSAAKRRGSCVQPYLASSANVLRRAASSGAPALSELRVEFSDVTTTSRTSRTIGDGGVPIAAWKLCRPPGLAGLHQVDNAAACLAALDALSSRVRLNDEAVRSGIAGARIEGRLQWLETPARVLVDVAHNPLGAEALAAYLASVRPRPRRRAVCGVLGDKDAGAMLRALEAEVDAWYFASLAGTRGPQCAGTRRENSPARCRAGHSTPWTPHSRPRSTIAANVKRSWFSVRS